MNTILFLSMVSLGADPEARLQFDRTSVDRGEVKSGVPLIETFRVRNVTGSSISITSLTGGCGCLKPKISSQVILAGETAEVRLEVNTLSQPVGPNRWKLNLKYRGDGQKELEQSLEVTANLAREINVEPASLIVVTSEAVSKEIVVKSVARKPVTLKGVSTTVPHLKADIANGTLIRVQFPATAPAGDHQGYVSIQTDDPEHAELRVPVQFVKRAAKAVQASPDELSLRLAVEQKVASGLVRLRDAEDRPVLIEKWESDQTALSVKFTPGPGNMSTVRVNVDSSSAASGEGVIRLHLKSPDQQVVVIPVRWGR